MDSRKHPMTLLRDTTALIRELACSMNVLSAKMENCAGWPQMTTVLIPTLTLTQTQMKFHFINGKPRISMSRKFGLRCRLMKPLICLKPLSPPWRNISNPKEYKGGSTIESKNLLTMARFLFIFIVPSLTKMCSKIKSRVLTLETASLVSSQHVVIPNRWLIMAMA